MLYHFCSWIVFDTIRYIPESYESWFETRYGLYLVFEWGWVDPSIWNPNFFPFCILSRWLTLLSSSNIISFTFPTPLVSLIFSPFSFLPSFPSTSERDTSTDDRVVVMWLRNCSVMVVQCFGDVCVVFRRCSHNVLMVFALLEFMCNVLVVLVQ